MPQRSDDSKTTAIKHYLNSDKTHIKWRNDYEYIELPKNIQFLNPEYKRPYIVKYINDSRNIFLIPSSPSSMPEIRYFNLDDVYFSVRRFELCPTTMRKHAIVYAHNTKSKPNVVSRNVFYTSKSDGYFWRYCISREGGGYAKGADYVCGTMINLELQVFLFDEEKRHTFVKRVHDPKDCQNYEKLTIFLKNRVCKSINISPSSTALRLIRTYFSMSSRENPTNFNKALKHLYQESETFQRDYPKYYNGSNLSKLVDSIYRGGVKAYENGSSITHHYALFYQALLQYFKSSFTLSKEKKLFNRVVVIDDVNITMQICRITILENRNKTLHYLYYYRYVIIDEKPSKVRTQLLYCKPLKDNHITEYGLDKFYNPTGMLIDKIYDYFSQIKKTKTRMDAPESGYIFQGDIFDARSLFE